MPVYATRKLRSFAAALILLSGLTHVAQLWLLPLAGPVLVDAGIGMIYLLLGLGLSGQGRFSLWLGILAPATFAIALFPVRPPPPDLLSSWNLMVELLVLACCVYILIKTRNEPMD